MVTNTAAVCPSCMHAVTSSIHIHYINNHIYIQEEKPFTHEKREQAGMDLVRSTEANRNHTSMHVIINSIILTPAILYTNIATICTSIYYTVHAYFFQTKL